MVRIIYPLAVGTYYPNTIAACGIGQLFLELCTILACFSKSPGYDDSGLDPRSTSLIDGAGYGL